MAAIIEATAVGDSARVWLLLRGGIDQPASDGERGFFQAALAFRVCDRRQFVAFIDALNQTAIRIAELEDRGRELDRIERNLREAAGDDGIHEDGEPFDLEELEDLAMRALAPGRFP